MISANDMHDDALLYQYQNIASTQGVGTHPHFNIYVSIAAHAALEATPTTVTYAVDLYAHKLGNHALA